MRVVGEIPHPDCKITLLAWNNRYLVKLEQGYIEQTFKIDQFDINSDADLLTIVDQEFIEKALNRFAEMAQDWSIAIQKV
ncbi:MAG TPA: hypothetical protein PLJ60_07650 [Chryseolinea sp.]|nr:hypothetical protein [Chryseolinea sp.]HPM30197.1 hypothetical protein [Chryseolinea sp.]